MGKIYCLLLGIFVVSLFSSGCSTHGGFVGHAIMTNVNLECRNFKVISSVSGHSSASYMFGMGPPEQNLVDRARRDMIKNAKLIGNSRAIINATTDIKYTFIPILLRRKTVYVAGEVVQCKP